MSDAQALQAEREMEQLLIQSWAFQRVRRMAASQVRGPLKSIVMVLEKLYPRTERVVGP